MSRAVVCLWLVGCGTGWPEGAGEPCTAGECPAGLECGIDFHSGEEACLVPCEENRQCEGLCGCQDGWCLMGCK